MTDRTIKNIKKYFNTLERILTAKISEKKTLQDFRGNTYSKNSKYNFFKFFFVFPIYKSVKYKNESNISRRIQKCWR